MKYYTYIIRCTDNSLYTGMTNDLNKRMEEHFGREKEGAKYTKSHQAQRVEAVWQSKDKSLACKLEYRIKTLTKAEKESIIKGEKLKTYFSGILDCRKYRSVKIKNILDKDYWE